jgi:hypothetical protein
MNKIYRINGETWLYNEQSGIAELAEQEHELPPAIDKEIITVGTVIFIVASVLVTVILHALV